MTSSLIDDLIAAGLELLAKATPRPWDAPVPYGEHDLEIAGNRRSIAIIRAKRRQEDLRVICDGWTAEDMANARLISAAPDLLEALTELLDRYVTEMEGESNLKPEDVREVIKACAAIDKAVGRLM